jgi:ubiquinone biosynthesis protein COQ9
MTPPERSPERDAAIVRLLDLVPAHGWSIAALRGADAELADLDLLFPGGAVELIEAAIDFADRRMEQDAAAADFGDMGLTRRVRAIVLRRLEAQRPHREAIRRALAILALPRHARVAARITARTIDAIWFAAGDNSSDFSWYTKRAILAVVYSATLLYWLRDYTGDDSATAEFLDRRLAGLGRVFRIRSKIAAATDRLHRREAA